MDLLDEITLPTVATMLTFTVILLHLIMRVGCGRASPNIALFYDDAHALNYQHQYVVRLLYGPKSFSFRDASTTIFVEVEHSINRIVKIPFTPATMERVIGYGSHRCAKVFIRTVERYSNIRNSLLYHNGRGSIVVVAVQLQDIGESNSITSMVGQPVFGPAGAQHQNARLVSYPFGREEKTVLEEDIKPTRNVTLPETAFFLFTVVNVIYLLVILALEHFCVTAACNVTSIFVMGVAVGGIAYLLFLVLIIPYRYGVRRYYHVQLGRGCAALLKIFYLFVMVCAGVAAGVFCAQRSMEVTYREQVNKHVKILYPWVVWAATTAFAAFCLLVLMGISVPLAVYNHFILLSDDDQEAGIFAQFLSKRDREARYTRNTTTFTTRGGGAHGDTTRGGQRFSTSTNTSYGAARKYKSSEAFQEAVSYMSGTSSAIEDSPGNSTLTRNAPSSPDPGPRKMTPLAVSPPTKEKNKKQKDQKDQKNQQQQHRKGQRTTMASSPRGHHRGDGDGYAAALATGHGHVRSISQYEDSDEDDHHLSPKTPKKKVPKKKKKTVRRKDDNKRTKAVTPPISPKAKRTPVKVKSNGIGTPPPTKPKTGGRAEVTKGHSVPKSPKPAAAAPKPIESAIDDSSRISSAASDGGNYFRTMVKVAKVKSVSEYVMEDGGKGRGKSPK